jgi:hypothetical protein
VNPLVAPVPADENAGRSTRGDLDEMKRRHHVTCDDCFFQRNGLCALLAREPCPTFRESTSGTLEPPRQPRLVPLTQPQVAVGHAA